MICLQPHYFTPNEANGAMTNELVYLRCILFEGRQESSISFLCLVSTKVTAKRCKLPDCQGESNETLQKKNIPPRLYSWDQSIYSIRIVIDGETWQANEF